MAVTVVNTANYFDCVEELTVTLQVEIALSLTLKSILLEIQACVNAPLQYFASADSNYLQA